MKRKDLITLEDLASLTGSCLIDQGSGSRLSSFGNFRSVWGRMNASYSGIFSFHGLLFLISLTTVLVRWIFFPGYFGADDAYIHKAVVENWTEGLGWGINPAEPVGLSTAPLFTVLMGALSLLPGDLLQKGSLVTQGASVIGCYLAGLIAHQITGDRVAAVTASLFAASNAMLWRWTGSFMETTIAFAMVMLVAYVHYRLLKPLNGSNTFIQYVWLGVLCGASALFRPELGTLPFLISAAIAIMAAPQVLLRTTALFLGAGSVGVLYAVFAMHTWGSILPTTYSAKTTDTFNIQNLSFVINFGETVVVSALGAALAIAIWLRNVIRSSNYGSFRELALLLLIPLVGFSFFYFKAHDLQSPGRYLLPFTGPMAVLGGVVVSRFANALVSSIVFVGIQTTVSLAFLFFAVAPVLQVMEDGYVKSMAGAAEALNDVCEENDKVLVAFDLGVIADRNRSACRIADGGALASPELLGLPVWEMLSVTKAKFLIQSLGSENNSMSNWLSEKGFRLTEIYSSKFPSHGVSHPDLWYVVRLFEVTPEN